MALQQEEGRWAWWLRWVAANAGAELIGLGGSALLWAAGMLYLGDRIGVIPSAIGVVVGATLLEGTAVGVAQGMVLRRRLPQLPLRTWWLATGLGALVAWILGMTPSTMMDLAEMGGSGPPPEVSDALQLLLAAGMGLVLGPILALAQWWVLRRHVAGAGWWIPANALAWAVGMPVIFLGLGLAVEVASVASAVAVAALCLLVAGAVVGAVHGLFLVRLLFGRANRRDEAGLQAERTGGDDTPMYLWAAQPAGGSGMGRGSKQAPTTQDRDPTPDDGGSHDGGSSDGGSDGGSGGFDGGGGDGGGGGGE